MKSGRSVTLTIKDDLFRLKNIHVFIDDIVAVSDWKNDSCDNAKLFVIGPHEISVQENAETVMAKIKLERERYT